MSPASGSSTSTGPVASPRSASSSSPLRRGRPSSRPTNCHSHRPAAWCNGWAGPFLYEGEVPVTSQWEIGYHAAPIEKNMPKFLGSFDAIWEERKWELELGLGYSRARFPQVAGRIGQYLEDARTFKIGPGRSTSRSCTPCWPSTSSSTGSARPTGSTPGTSPRCCRAATPDHGMRPDHVGSGRRSRAARHRRAVRPGAPADPRSLSTAGGNASVWLTKFDDFLKSSGWRTEGIADINIPSWIEDQSSHLGQLRNFVGGGAHDFDRRWPLPTRRDEAIEAARSQLNGDGPRRLQPAARHLHRRQLRLVERRSQLLHRSAFLDPGSAGCAGRS